jgi:hypothetical protein
MRSERWRETEDRNFEGELIYRRERERKWCNGGVNVKERIWFSFSRPFLLSLSAG